ncbi:uncharacterized protein LOC129906287 isoform X1 [Episyrphus balteatus]|uniref:uncharacterized protein LOC129906287 isoform X1 n=1 Tax=Episyrphus balteatus TaxID=286459 RepID=UPI0024861FC3|nr:uncharacterized protein LOC129906287 isoform X1 [Episyrphus balteatus]
MFNEIVSFSLLLFIIWLTMVIYVKLRILCCPPEMNLSNNTHEENVRQAAVYTIATDPRRGNDSTSNFPDFFWDVSPPRSNEPAKDDKDLPSYEEVMRIEMARQVVDSTIQATPITTSTTTNTVQQTLPSSQPVRLPV